MVGGFSLRLRSIIEYAKIALQIHGARQLRGGREHGKDGVFQALGLYRGGSSSRRHRKAAGRAQRGRREHCEMEGGGGALNEGDGDAVANEG